MTSSSSSSSAHNVTVVIRKMKAFGRYDWEQARWECSCGAVGHYGNEKKAEKNGEDHIKRASVSA